MTVLVAGVDSSTQSCKVVVRDAGTGVVVRTGRAPHPDGTEVDPAAWWTALGAAVADAGGLGDVRAIAIGGQQHGLVALDAEGRVVRPAMLWNDTRSAGAARDLVDELGAEAWASRTGLVPVASFTATKLRWMRDAEPDLVRRIAAVALPHDWLSWRLRGYGPADESPNGPDLDALATDASDASGTAYWSPRSGEYDADLFERALGRPLRVASGVGGGDPVGRPGAGPTGTAPLPTGTAGSPPARRSGTGSVGPARVTVPRVVATGARMAVLDGPVPLPGAGVAPAGLVVAGGAGDNAAAALGLGVGPGDVVVSLGTSGTVFASPADVEPDPTGTVAGFADATGGRLPIVTTLNAARVLDTVGTLLEVDHDGLGRLATTIGPGADGLVLVPYFVGERTPNLPDATASLHGMTLRTTTREHLARAAVEGMLCALADGVDAMRGRGVPVGRILLVGGAARNEAVRAVARTVFDVPIGLPEPGEYVALGAAVQAAEALTGTRPRWAVATESIAPTPEPAVRDAYAAARRSALPAA